MLRSSVCIIFVGTFKKTMKRYLLFIACCLVLTACKETGGGDTPTQEADTLVAEKPDSTLWGRMGSGTGMSALEFITEQGDTLELYRTDPYTGEDGLLMGEIRNAEDRFAVTLSADEETMRTAINVSQLEEIWKKAKTAPYEEWQLWNGRLLLSSKQKQEVGTVTRIDTVDILWLDRDSLVIQNHLKQRISFK